MARILVADDEEGLRVLYALWLSQDRHEVRHVADGEAALAMLQDDSNDFAMAVIDLVMPKRDGISVIKQIRKDGGTLPILAISAGQSHLPASVGLPLSSMFGADEVLYKPFNKSEFLGAVRRLLG